MFDSKRALSHDAWLADSGLDGEKEEEEGGLKSGESNEKSEMFFI